MKRLLTIAAVIMIALGVKAQEFDELTLLGKWNVTSMTGSTSPDGIKSFKAIAFGDVPIEDDNVVDDGYVEFSYNIEYSYFGAVIYNPVLVNPDDEDSEEIEYSDFFISNNNKLHISETSNNNSLRFVIEKLTDTEMELRTYDGKCHISLTKDPSAINRINEEQKDAPSVYYDLNGMKISKPSKGIYIEKKGNSSRKAIVTN